MTALGIIGILVGTILLFYLALKGWSVYLAAPICGVIVALFSAVNPLTAIKDTYFPGAANMLITIFPVMLIGSVIAEFYRESGAATSIAVGLSNFSTKLTKGKPSVAMTFIIVNLIGFILAYGGINGVVVAVLAFPIALEMFKSVGIPREVAPAAVLSGSLTSCMIMPGSPQLQNVLPMRLLGTPSMAAAIPGFVVGILILAANTIILTGMTKKEIAKGNTFTDFEGMPMVNRDNLPNPWYSAIPLIVVFVTFNFFKLDVIGALALGMVLCALMFQKYFGGWDKIKPLSAKGALDSCGLALIVCSLSAYGTLVAAMPCFSSITEALVNMPGPALIKAAVALMIVTGVAGSGPAGIGAGLPMLQPAFQAMNINLNALHRIAAFSGVALDTMPSNAGINVASRLSGFTVMKTYKYAFMTTVLTTTLGTLLVAVMLTIFPNMA